MLIARSSLPENIVNNIKTRIILIIAKIGKMDNGKRLMAKVFIS